MSHKLNSAIAVIGIDIGMNSFHVVRERVSRPDRSHQCAREAACKSSCSVVLVDELHVGRCTASAMASASKSCEQLKRLALVVPSRAATRQAGAALPQSLPHRLASRHRSNAVAVPKECSGTRHYCLPFGQAFTNLGLILIQQAHEHLSGLDATATRDLNDGAARSVEDRGERNCRGATLPDLDRRTAERTRAQSRIAADENTYLAKLGRRIDRSRELSHLARQFSDADDLRFGGLIHGQTGQGPERYFRH
jgi:hypothetical protein